MFHDYTELQLWKTSVDLTVKIYSATNHFPKSELFGLTSQLKRSSVSIASNIAEGAMRRGNKEFLHFLNISYGSSAELHTQLLIATRLGFLNQVIYAELSNHIEKIQRMNHNLHKKILATMKS